MKYFQRVLRNTGIAGLLWLGANFGTFDDFSVDEWKPLILFIILFIGVELAHHYHISTTSNKKAQTRTFFF
jgi:hypothetical protein